jgi:3-deoxy-D-manno-octulosonic-acid transferase
MVLFFYNLALLAVLVLGAPWWTFRILTTQKYREGLLERLGLRPMRMRREKPVIWIHAVSVGEVLAIGRLVKRLEESLPEYELAISTTTRTGQALAKERFGAERVFYCPLDLPWAVGRVLRELNPRMLVLAETEFWPNLLAACRRRGIPVAVVNARISDRSWRRYEFLRWLWRGILRPLALVLAQTNEDARRLGVIGCVDVQVTGNLKFDVRAAEENEAVLLLRDAAAGRRVIVAGSTLDGEEEMLLKAWQEVVAARSEKEKLLLVIAPRHPERFDAVAALLEKSGLRWMRRSQWKQGGECEVVLLDTIGELAGVYQLAAVAFVGGSLVDAGGHNPLEPAQFGVPVVMGRSFENFRGIVKPMIGARGILLVNEEQLAPCIAGVLEDVEAAAELGRRGRAVFDQQSGATERTVTALCELLMRTESGR